MVSLIQLIYKSTCLILDYCNILLNNLKIDQSSSVCERSVAQIVSVSISVLSFSKAKKREVFELIAIYVRIFHVLLIL